MNDIITAESPSVVPALAPPVASRIAFTGSRPEFRRLVLRGGFFEFLTLGFYRFWLATDMRRHLWSNTSVRGDALEYTGTAKELLIGFLFALAILVPIYLIYFFIGLEAERYRRLPAFRSVSSSFCSTNSPCIGRGAIGSRAPSGAVVRFWMKGSGWAYAWRAGLWTLLVIITLGLALPWYQAALERYKMKHSYFGDLQGRFDGTGWQFFKRGAWIWFLALLILVLIVACAVVAAAPRVISSLGETQRESSESQGSLCSSWAPSSVGPLRTRRTRRSNGAGGRPVSASVTCALNSTLRMGALSGLYWAVIGWSFLIMTIVGAVVQAVVQTHGAAGKGPEEIAARAAKSFDPDRGRRWLYRRCMGFGRDRAHLSSARCMGAGRRLDDGP